MVKRKMAFLNDLVKEKYSNGFIFLSRNRSVKMVHRKIEQLVISLKNPNPLLH